MTDRALRAFISITVLVVGLGSGPALAADPVDLEVETAVLFINASGQVNDRVVRYRVKNIGERNSPKATGKLEILSPASGEIGLAVEALDPGESFDGFAQLPSPCDGHVVQVTINATGDGNLANNRFGPVKLCPEKPQSESGTIDDSIIVRGPSDVELSDMVEKRRVPHGAKLQPTGLWWQRRAFEHDVTDDFCALERVTEETYPWGTLPLGFSNHWDSDDCGLFQIYQARVVFDVSEFGQHPLFGGAVPVANLSYSERVEKRTGPPGRGDRAYTCVAGLRVAASPDPVDHLFAVRPEEFYRGGPVVSDPWAVADAVDGWVSGRVPNHGFVLYGWDETYNHGDAASCLSELSNFELYVAVVWLVP